MEEGYRVPRLEEFVQGFEFEKANDYSFGILDMSEGGNFISSSEKSRIWSPMKVWWKHNPYERIIEPLDNEGNTIEYSGEFLNFFAPFNEQSFIEQELVRVKINKK